MDKIINAFPGYEYVDGKNMYMGENVGFGGYVYAEPGIYTDVALLDIASQHPHSIIAMNCFGDYTKNFKELLDARIAIKHEDWKKVEKMLNGKLKPYIEQVKKGEMSSKDLANALKIAINSVYGLTSASFDNPFRDPRNINNIVALRGALFMVTLKHEVIKKGFKVAHIKTDSIKIPNATPEIINFVTKFGEKYGYKFEHEATYDRMCLVNDAVYIAKYKDGGWTATGTQFQVPFVYKTLFSHEDIVFDDMCETKSVSQGELYLDMNEDLPDVTDLEKELKKLEDSWKKANGETNGLSGTGSSNGGSMFKGSEEEFFARKAELEKEIAKGHNYIFVGRVGRFCPMIDGAGGGVLYRCKDGKYYAVTGTKGYRWLESEIVKNVGKEDMIDKSYYISLVDEAKDTISKYGDFEMFANADVFVPMDFMNIPEDAPEEMPWDPVIDSDHPKDSDEEDYHGTS